MVEKTWCGGEDGVHIQLYVYKKKNIYIIFVCHLPERILSVRNVAEYEKCKCNSLLNHFQLIFRYFLGYH